ncbi:MAG: ABC transporter ATP-binding protein [Rhizobiales bacterium]|nr:ABC transporter ATP-binding protein [Hyphomicrobiales bacterium]
MLVLNEPNRLAATEGHPADGPESGYVLRATDLTVAMRSGAQIIQSASLTLKVGQILGLVGESGSGKSTMAQALLGYAPPGLQITGEVEVGGRQLLELDEAGRRALRGRAISYVPQDASTALNPARRVGRIIEELLRHRLPSASSAEIAATISRLLVGVDLPADRNFLRRFPHELSGGQQQRLAIACAFGGDPSVVVMDEPTTGLDVIVQRRVLQLITALARSQRTAVVFVSHDLDTVAEIADSVCVMYSGRIIEQGPLKTVLRDPRHPYSKGLMEASPDMSRPSRLQGIAGKPPRVDQRPEGCAYHPRCPLAADICTAAVPELRQVGESHLARCVKSGEVKPFDLASAMLVKPRAVGPGPMLEAVDLRVSHGGTEVVHGVSLKVRVGQCVALVGQSGSGKSSFARAVIGLNRYTGGQVMLDGKVLAAAAGDRDSAAHRRIQYIFQSPHACLNPKRRAHGSVANARRTVMPSESAAARAENVARAFRRVGLSEALWHRYPGQLSGGERQRVAIARALVCEPQFLLCDEVTASLDVSVQAGIVELLRSLVDSGDVGILLITHQLPLVRSIADEVAVMLHGELVEQRPCKDIFERPETNYVVDLLQASPPSLRTYVAADAPCVPPVSSEPRF